MFYNPARTPPTPTPNQRPQPTPLPPTSGPPNLWSQMSPNRAANAPACPNRAKTRGSVVHAQATAASGTATNPRTTNPRTYDELVASKSGSLRRLYTIVCVIILEILQRMAMMDNPALKPLPSTVLARAIAGDNFGLPAPLAATIRLLAREIQRFLLPEALAPNRSQALAAPPAAIRASPSANPPATITPPRPAANPRRDATRARETDCQTSSPELRPVCAFQATRPRAQSPPKSGFRQHPSRRKQHSARAGNARPFRCVYKTIRRKTGPPDRPDAQSPPAASRPPRRSAHPRAPAAAASRRCRTPASPLP